MVDSEMLDASIRRLIRDYSLDADEHEVSPEAKAISFDGIAKLFDSFSSRASLQSLLDLRWKATEDAEESAELEKDAKENGEKLKQLRVTIFEKIVAVVTKNIREGLEEKPSRDRPIPIRKSGTSERDIRKRIFGTKVGPAFGGLSRVKAERAARRKEMEREVERSRPSSKRPLGIEDRYERKEKLIEEWTRQFENIKNIEDTRIKVIDEPLHLELYVHSGGETIMEWWGDELNEAIELGIISPLTSKSLHRSAYQAAKDAGKLPNAE